MLAQFTKLSDKASTVKFLEINKKKILNSDQKVTMVVDDNHPTYLLSLAAICINSLMFEVCGRKHHPTKLCTPSEGSTTCLKYVEVSSESDCIILAPLRIVLATSKARIDMLHPFVFALEIKPPSGLMVVIKQPNVSNIPTALPNPAMLAVPSSEPSLGTCYKS
jgi:hypothetical protein